MTLRKVQREIKVTKLEVSRCAARQGGLAEINQKGLQARLDALEEIERLMYGLQLKIVQLEDFYR